MASCMFFTQFNSKMNSTDGFCCDKGAPRFVRNFNGRT